MLDELNTLIVKSVALVCSLSVAWMLMYAVLRIDDSQSAASSASFEMTQNNTLLIPVEIATLETSPSPTSIAQIAQTEVALSIASSTQSPKPSPSPALQRTLTPSPTLALTPTPVTTVSATPAQPIASVYDALFEQWSTHFGVDIQLLKYIARCESRFNPASVGGIYGGLYQFSASTWKSTRNAMSHDPDPALRFDANEAIKTAAFKIANGGKSAWKNCLPK